MPIIRVKNAAALTNALRTVRGGDTILLAPGDYDTVYLSRLNFSTPVTIASANSSNLAHIDQLTVANSSGLNFRSIDFGRGLNDGEPGWIKLVAVNNSQNVTFNSVRVHGSLDGDPTNDGGGLSFRGVTNVSVNNSTFTQLSTAASSYESRGVTIAGNQFTNLRTDGIQVAATTDITIDRNTFRDFTPVAGDHPDAIQFFTQGTTVASQNIRITNNVMNQGDGAGFQSIFLRDELGTLPYQNVLIENNASAHDSAYNGIGVGGANNVTIRGNSITSKPGDGIDHWIRVENVTNGRVENNVSDQIITKNNTGVIFTNNTSTAGAPLSKTSSPAPEAGGIADQGGKAAIDPTGILVGTSREAVAVEGGAAAFGTLASLDVFGGQFPSSEYDFTALPVIDYGQLPLAYAGAIL